MKALGGYNDGIQNQHGKLGTELITEVVRVWFVWILGHVVEGASGKSEQGTRV